ncbi:GNAT family N-acetyltransferase [Mesorhizobium sp. NBSH29]|nr:GNAT family N-acetyltransferase [Mesorhizobium sp. NBSH29]
MVDAAAAGRQSRSVASGARSAHVRTDPDAALVAYRNACTASSASPSQDFGWIDAWARHVVPDFIVATLGPVEAPVFALALEVVKSGPLKVARFMGERHANGNFAPLSGIVAPSELDALFAAIHAARPDIDMLALERLAETCGTATNPLLAFQNAPSANLALAVSLEGGFEALLSRTSGKRKRKKHRSQQRKFEAAGGFRRVEAKTPADVDALLDAFFVMKDERFRKLGIANVFGRQDVQSFFRALFAQALAENPPAYVLHGLEVDGQIRAITGSSRTCDRLVCEFGSISDDELASTSPGDFLFFENIREACEGGLSVYDFSVGDEPYKRLWCDLEIIQYDVLVPLTRRGALLAHVMRARNRITSFVKNSPLAWRLAKALRRRRGQGSAPVAEE